MASSKKQNHQVEYGKLLAEIDIKKIKKDLIENVKNAHYSTQDGATIVSCIHEISHSYLQFRSEIENSRWPYSCCYYFDVNPQFSDEYYAYIRELKKLAAKDNISIEVVLHNQKTNTTYPFPYKFKDKTFAFLAIQAKAVIS